ncbi:MAG: hypothetical protein J3K34DRAFT_15043 [Monoraphidium minutum]|nr:MAG: hypothetical protein J3K34DRAFT_15043 [Monoraphidium minutum]
MRVRHRSVPTGGAHAPRAGCRVRVAKHRVKALDTRAVEAEAQQAQALEDGLVALARQALMNDPEAAAQLKRYEAAVVRLEKAQAAERELDAIMAEAAAAAVLEDAAARDGACAAAGQLLADAEVAAAEKLLAAAQIEFDQAEAQRARAGALAFSAGDRAESWKAAALAAAGGLAAAAPLALAAGGGGGGELLSLADVAVCCALFGPTYRYVVREDAHNKHLRGGAVTAFALVRAAGALDALQRSSAAVAAASGSGGGGNGGGLAALLSPDVLGPSALFAGECMLVFGFAVAALEAGFAGGLVRRMRGTFLQR